MLHFETIENRTLDLLIRLQSLPAFSNLRLVGGTALALQIGHRKSIDLDLFGLITADEYEISKQLSDIGNFTELKKSGKINIYLIDGIKVDIVDYHYQWLEKPVIESKLVLADKNDIAAMKLAAITGRGAKKDFIDLFYLLKIFNLKQILDFYSLKYSEGSEFLVLKSLSYFEDADSDENPVMLDSFDWNNIKISIRTVLENYLKKQDK